MHNLYFFLRSEQILRCSLKRSSVLYYNFRIHFRFVLSLSAELRSVEVLLFDRFLNLSKVIPRLLTSPNPTLQFPPNAYAYIHHVRYLYQY